MRHGQSMYEVEKYNNVNVMGTAHMLEILANSNHNVKKVVVASSRSIMVKVNIIVKIMEFNILQEERRRI